MDTNGRGMPLLRSINNRHSSFVRFINTTSHDIEVFWIDYAGQAVCYGTLNPSDRLDINTFATHPWIFIEKDTRDRFVVDGKDVYLPQPWFIRYRNVSRDRLPPTIERIQVNITLPIYTLRDLSLRVIKRLLRSDCHAFFLEIPQNLQHELASMQPRKGEPAEP